MLIYAIWRFDPLNQSFSTCSWKRKGTHKPDFGKYKDEICLSPFVISGVQRKSTGPLAKFGDSRCFDRQKQFQQQRKRSHTNLWYNTTFEPQAPLHSPNILKTPLLSQLMPSEMHWKLQRVSSLAAGLLWHCLITIMLITIFFQFACSFSYIVICQVRLFLCD